MTNVNAAKKIIELYNELYGQNIGFEDIVKTSQDRLGHDKKYWISSKKLNDLVGGKYTSFETGIRETLRKL
jgi:dTDP-D-glucose 4,6-dehydratase